MHHLTDRIAHTTAFVVEHWLERDFGGVKHTFNGDVLRGEVLFSDESHFMLFRADGHFRMNVMPPIVFWNMIISMMVVLWYGKEWSYCLGES